MKVVIPAAGMGTRLLPMTKEIPKEILPIIIKNDNGKLVLKPMMQQIFEGLYEVGFREYCFIVGRGKRVIEDHFTADDMFLSELKSKKQDELAIMIEEFYSKIDHSTIIFVNQPKPRGFGDAIYRAKIFTGNEPFIMHAGDDIIMSKKNDHIKRLQSVYNEYSADAVFFIEELENPTQYGVIKGDEIRPNIYRVSEIIEKPKDPPSKLAIIAIYMFNPYIYKAIEKCKPDKSGEIQLADALQILLEEGKSIYAIKLEPYEKRIDIGTPSTYRNVLDINLLV